MNYHVILKDKYFSRYIEDIYELGLESENVFWVQGDEEATDLFSTNRPVVYLGKDKAQWVEKFKQIQPGDKLIVSWYSTALGEAILKAKVKAPLYVCYMGGDLYIEPKAWHAGWLFDDLTKNRLNEIGYLPNPSFFSRGAAQKSLIKRLKTPFHYCRWKCSRYVSYKRKLKTVERIDYITVSEIEYKFLKKLYPTINAKTLKGIWDQNFDLAASIPYHEHSGEMYDVQIGNSADPSNNYIDAFRCVKENLHYNYNVHCFLSYAIYAGNDWIIDAGKQYFGDRFVPVVGFMQRKEYMDYINNIDVLVMYHNRQQAYGNIATALVLGKPVFMKASNVVYQRLKSMGIVPLYDVATLGDVPLEERIEEAKLHREETSNILRQLHAKEVRLKNWMDIIG